MKDELGVKIMAEFVGFRPKTYSYLMDDGNSDKKQKKQRLQNPNKDLKMNHIMYIEKKLIKLN